LIRGNAVGSPGDAFNGGIFAYGGATAEIVGNTVRGAFQSGSVSGQPILVQDAIATITGNVVEDTAAAPDFVYGILLFDFATAPDTAATLRRNQLYGGGAADGINVLDAASVTSESDLVTGFGRGLATTDLSADSPTAGNVDATGLTAFGNVTSDIMLDSASLILDSSIVGSNIATQGTGIGGGVVECSITFSRGPTMTPGGNGCAGFQTTADPAFVDESPVAGDPDLHLTAGSPMIDQGDPAAPANSAVDIDGDPRALDGGGDCPEELRRDIGADEFGDLLDCDPPQTTIKGKKRTRKARARFRLRSNEAGSTFRCKLDGQPYRKCKGRYRTPRLDPGRHKLRARAIDPAGNQDPTPAIKRFRIRPAN
jgi:hypothetical protein